jgi:hypothetical protein
MAQAGSDQPRPERKTERDSDRRATDRRAGQQDFAGDDRRAADRRSGKDRRDS